MIGSVVHISELIGGLIEAMQPQQSRRDGEFLAVNSLTVSHVANRSSIPTVHDIDPSRQIYHISPVVYDLARAAGWDPYDLHDLQ